MYIYILIKIMIIPISFTVYVAKLGLAFVMNGIQGVQKMLKIGTFA